MKEHNIFLPKISDCQEYTLFLDRDGVINKPIVDDYAKRPEDFIFCDKALDALSLLQRYFGRIVLVTNQQGVHRNVMSEKDLENVHLKMYRALKKEGIEYFDASFFAPYLKTDNHTWRKPNNGMLLKAKSYLPKIDWEKAIMVGDSPGDMLLADSLDILKVKIQNPQFDFHNQDFEFSSLYHFVDSLSN